MSLCVKSFCDRRAKGIVRHVRLVLWILAIAGAGTAQANVLSGVAADTNGEWVCGCVVPRSAKAAVLVPHSVGRVQHPDWAELKPGETFIRCDPGWGMTYRMVAVLNESGDSYAIVQKGAREYASFLRVRQGTAPGTVLLESGYVPDADNLRTGEVRHPFETRVIPFRGGWFAAARVYREVVRDEPWLKAARARDFGRMREIGIWIWNRRTSDIVIPPVEKFMRDAGVPVALDWFWWHRIPYDTSYPNFWPPREPEADFRAAVKRLNAAGVYCQTYLNGMLWDADDPYWADGGEQEALRQRDGSITATAWNRFSNHRLASVCGDAPRFQAKIRALCRTLRGCGFDGQYLDCIGNSAYGACWATNHGHAAGGGDHMVKNYRRYLNAVRRENPGLQLCTEDVNETYMDTFESLNISSPNYERFEKPGVVGFEQVPVFPAVYHGAVVMYGGYAMLDGIPPWDPLWPDAERWTEEKPWEELFPDQFPVEIARGVIWGLLPTVHNLKIENTTEARYRSHYDFMIATARFYHANRDLLFDGEMLSPGRIACARQEVEFLQRGIYTKKGEYGVGRHELPTVFHSVWRAPSGRIAAVLVNWSRVPQRYRLQSEDVSSEGEIPARTWRVVR